VCFGGGGGGVGGRREREVKDPTIMAQNLRGFAHYGKVQSSNQCCSVLLKKKVVVGFWYYSVI